MPKIKDPEIKDFIRNEEFIVEDAPVEVCGTFGREEFESVLGDIRDAISLVPKEVRSGTLLQIFDHYPDRESREYQGGAYGRVQTSNKSDTLLVQIFPRAWKRSDVLRYTIGHEFGEVAWERLPEEKKKSIGRGFNKERWMDQKTRSWGFSLPK